MKNNVNQGQICLQFNNPPQATTRRIYQCLKIAINYTLEKFKVFEKAQLLQMPLNVRDF